MYGERGENARSSAEHKALTPTWLPRGQPPLSGVAVDRRGREGSLPSRQGKVSFSPSERHGPGRKEPLQASVFSSVKQDQQQQKDLTALW